jgi:hypothetical protein
MNCVGGAVRADRGNLSSHSAPTGPPLESSDALIYHPQRDGSLHSSSTTTSAAPRAVRDLWQLHRPQKPQAILTAAIFRTETGYELVKRRYAGVEGSTNVPLSV